MQTLRDSVYVLVAAGSLVMAACQPSDGLADLLGRNVDNAPHRVGTQADPSAQRARQSPDLLQAATPRAEPASPLAWTTFAQTVLAQK